MGTDTVVRGRDEYTYPTSSLRTGASLGNLFAFAQLSPTSDIHGLWGSLDNRFVLGRWEVVLELDGKPFDPTDTVFRPESQSTKYIAHGCSAEKTVFLPFSMTDRQPADAWRYQAAIMNLRLESDDRERMVTIRHKLTIPAIPSDLFTKKPPQEETESKAKIVRNGESFEITTEGREKEARVFGGTTKLESHASLDTTVELTVHIRVAPQSPAILSFVYAFSGTGIEDARRTFNSLHDGVAQLQSAAQAWKGALRTTTIVTPDPVINRGIVWAKVNTLRVMHRFRLGEAFTNDPPQDIVVVRDLGWFVLGADYVSPEFTRNMIACAERFAFHPDGKLTEFIRADEPSPELHDYKLNINDDTPLYVYALHHHASATGDAKFLNSVLPSMERASAYIESQISDGLVRCTAKGTNVWGICGWRNIIDDYTLNGAVTEINVECVKAFEATADAFRSTGHDKGSQRWNVAATSLRHAIERELTSSTTGMYLLNIDQSGTRHHDVTGDLIFPVMFRVADAERRDRILRRLIEPDMWTPYGTRTVAPSEPNYDPDFGYQLMGGVWPNLTAWTAYCIRHEQPDRLVEGMRNIYQLSETDRPRDFVNVVPGQFPERMHGETFVSRGMTMSPWMPPTYVWLAIEGLLGIEPTLKGRSMRPALPASWSWAMVRDLPLQGVRFSAVVHEGVLYASHVIESELPLKVGRALQVEFSDERVQGLAFTFNDETVVFAASVSGFEGMATMNLPNGTAIRSFSIPQGGCEKFTLTSDVHVPL